MNTKTKMEMPQTLMEWALYHAAQGWPVFPCKPMNKAPWTPHGHLDATTDPAQITAWWRKSPNAMIGGATGHVADVVDLDRKPGGDDGVMEWEQLEQKHGKGNTHTVETPSTGQHKYFQHQAGIRNIPLDGLAPGIEVKGEGGYVILPPSVMSNGKGYTVINASAPAPMPAWLLQMIHVYRNHSSDPGPDPETDYEPDDTVDQELWKEIQDDMAHGRGVQFEENEADKADETNIDKIKAALDVIPSDDYHDWFKNGAALFNQLGNSGEELFEYWSRKSKKFNKRDCVRKWKQVQSVNNIKIASVFWYAEQKDPSWRERYEQQRFQQEQRQQEQEQRQHSSSSDEGPQTKEAKSKSQIPSDLLKNAADLQYKTFDPLRWIVKKYLLEGATWPAHSNQCCSLSSSLMCAKRSWLICARSSTTSSLRRCSNSKLSWTSCALKSTCVRKWRSSAGN